MVDYLKNVLSAAADGTLVLTANKRLFRHLRDQFDQQMVAAGMQVWSTPQIFSFAGWLNRCLEDLGDGWQLLNPHQQQWLWEQEIEASSRGTTLELLQLSKTAEKAIQAHRLLTENDLTLEGEYLTEDQQVFQRWRHNYQTLCKQRGWFDLGEVPRQVCAALVAGKLDLPQSVLLIGFDQLPPGLQQLMLLIRDSGGSCSEVSLHGASPAQMTRYAACDSCHEIESVARWVRYHLDRRAKSIGVVVPDLQQRRSQIERIFREQIDPVATVARHDEESVFGLSLGTPLADQGVVRAALECLGVGHQLSLDQLSFLLRTPYLGGAEKEGDSRARFEQKLRSFRQQKFKLSRLQSLLKTESKLSGFAKISGQFQTTAARNDRALPGEWAERFAGELYTLGWPGERGLASSEYQAIKVWQEKGLAALVTLDSLQQPINRQRALQLLRRSSQGIEFQLESSPGPVQVVGLLESSGLTFDHLWVMGMGEMVLPAKPQPNPFIPIKLQQQHDMPHASAARELQFSEQVIARLQAASTDIVFSYPRSDGDTSLLPSPLIPAAAEENLLPFANPQDVVSLQKKVEVRLDEVTDWHGPPLTAGQVDGGTSLLKDQAHCPFRAFVHHRLKGERLAEAISGIDPMARGNLIHLVLEKIWQQLQDQANLLVLDPQQRSDLIRTQVTAAIDSYYSSHPAPSAQLLQLEAERITLVVSEWLEKEAQRDPFRVAETEQLHVEQIGPLQVRLKIDRIDDLEGGRRVVIDYKTGSDINPKDFLTQPLIEPQLPVYAVADSKTDGIAFARLRRGECGFAGIARKKGLLPGVNEFLTYSPAHELGIGSWNELITFWQAELTRLATEFSAGEAVVNPYDRKKSCEYCDLIGLCRIAEAGSLSGGES